MDLSIKNLAIFLLCLVDINYAKMYRFDYEWNDEIKGWLKYHAIPTTWDNARLRCDAEGAVLASPLTNQLKSAILSFARKKIDASSYLKSNNSVINNELFFTEFVPDYAENQDIILDLFFVDFQIFSGVHSIFSDGDYSSIEGVPLSRLPVIWEKDEPDNHEDSERCLSMRLDEHGSMADNRCETRLPYVCYKNDTYLTTSDCGTTDPEYVMDNETGSCYKFHRQGLPWRQAYMTCFAEGSYLAIINDDREASAIKYILRRESRKEIRAQFLNSVFVGFHDWNTHGRSFRTIHGERLETKYYRWASGQPDNSTRNDFGADLGEYCGSVTKEDVLLNDSYCGSYLTFLCEKDPRSLLNL